MKTIKITLLFLIVFTSIIIGGKTFVQNDIFRADMFSEADITTEKPRYTLNPVSTDSLSDLDKKISQTFETASLKNKNESSLDYPEHLSLQQSEVFGMAHSRLSLRIKEKKALGSLSFDMVYGKDFVENGILNIKAFESYVAENIIFTHQDEICPTTAVFVPIDEELERLQITPTKVHTFSLTVECAQKIISASIRNTLFTENNAEFSHFISIFFQDKKGRIKILKSALTTKLFPSLEWNTEKEISQSDSDLDGLSDYEENLYGTNPDSFDTDGDGTSDYEEIEKGFNPLIPHSL